MSIKTIEPEQKALEINLDESVYGTFAEIGAGQEVARYFFQAGAAAGTIAKTMSAYDKTYSDEIYGPEASGRYVCESRLYKMLDHEFELMNERLKNTKPNTSFFVFADTVATLNYTKTIKGDGWLGMRFQLAPNSEPNDIVLHVKMLDNDTRLQQQAVGILGVNLIYACFRYTKQPQTLVHSLLDSLKGRISVDMIRLTGPDFKNLDNRLLSLYLVKNGLSDVAIFGPNGHNIHASEFLYRKNVLVVRGSYRPYTNVNEDMIQSCYQQFISENSNEVEKCKLLTEITLDNLRLQGQIEEKDFLERAKGLCAMGYYVIISDCEKHEKLIHYLSDYKVPKIGLAVGIRPFLYLVNNTYKKFLEQTDGSLLADFGVLFPKTFKQYLYPAKVESTGEVFDTTNTKLPEEVNFIFQYLKERSQIVDIKNYDAKVLDIYSKHILDNIKGNTKGWESYVPEKIATIIREEKMFDFNLEADFLPLEF